jgi:hypothetical protein
MSTTEPKEIVHTPDQVFELPRPLAIEPFDPRRYMATREIAVGLSKSELIPKAYHGKPEDIMLAMETLRTVGLNPVTALSSTFVINSKVKIYGEAWLGIIQSTPGYGGMAESWDPKLDGGTATTTFRRFIAAVWQSLTKSFSMEQAKMAKLAGKDTYGTYPQDMLTWRARTRAGALFSDRLQGLQPAEAGEEYALELDARPEPPSVPIDTTEAKKLAENPNRSTHVIEKVVLDRESKPDSKTKWALFRIDTVDGAKFYTKEPDVADFATSLTGKAVAISFAPAAQDMRAVTKIEPVE